MKWQRSTPGVRSQARLATLIVVGAAMSAASSHPGAQAPSVPAPLLWSPAPRTHTGLILLGTSAALVVYGQRKWWQDGFRGRFTAVNEGWFGQRTYSGGADKLGHFYMTHAATRLLAWTLAHEGTPDQVALRTAAWYTLGAFAAIEVLDGFSKQWRFSREDMLMNAAGVGTAVLFARNPGLDRRFDLRLLYRRSGEEGGSFDPFGDYSGQTYLAVAKVAGFTQLPRSDIRRYLEFAVGYGTRGYGAGGQRQGQRNLYIGVSLNLSEALASAGPGDPGPARRLARGALEFIQVPGTAFLVRHPLRAETAPAPRFAAPDAVAVPPATLP